MKFISDVINVKQMLSCPMDKPFMLMIWEN